MSPLHFKGGKRFTSRGVARVSGGGPAWVQHLPSSPAPTRLFPNSGRGADSWASSAPGQSLTDWRTGGCWVIPLSLQDPHHYPDLSVEFKISVLLPH